MEFQISVIKDGVTTVVGRCHHINPGAVGHRILKSDDHMSDAPNMSESDMEMLASFLSCACKWESVSEALGRLDRDSAARKA